jgi:ABC-type multidrug transport system fused ATPase/permease subunit
MSNVIMVDAARKAHILDFIERLPKQFDTVVGERGILLSGGQRQRIALARAFARKPKLLILDEATSALDAESETAIREAITALRGEMTVIIISHRLSFIRDASSVFVLEQGRIVERGVPHELLGNSASYLRRMQSV